MTFFTILLYAVYKKKFFFRNICIAEKKSVTLLSILMRRLQFYPPRKGARGRFGLKLRICGDMRS